MNLKKLKIISVFGTFLLAFLTHFLYEFLPNNIFAIFFPVNESIWEHMKMLFTTIILYEVIEYIIICVKKIKVNNFFFAAFVSAIASIPIYLLLFLPIYYRIGEKMFIAISLMFIVIVIVQIINYKILNMKELNLDKFSVVLIVLSYVILGILTFNPPKVDLFFDTENEKYGINHYLTK